jgi:redox-sensitive bicupin YhaK (pirin superfamily)
MNASKTEPVHFLQIWVVPDARGLAPRYDQKTFDADAASQGLVLLASRDGRDGTIHVHQDVDLWMTRLAAGDERVHALAAGRHAWVHVAKGSAAVNGRALEEGDGAAISDEPAVRLAGSGEGEVLLFDLA